jgi:hypothetical protein
MKEEDRGSITLWWRCKFGPSSFASRSINDTWALDTCDTVLWHFIKFHLFSCKCKISHICLSPMLSSIRLWPMFPSMIFLRRYVDRLYVDGFHYMCYTCSFSLVIQVCTVFLVEGFCIALYCLVWSDRWSKPRSTAHDASTLSYFTTGALLDFFSLFIGHVFY